jgi:hypothetical protein
MEGNKNKKLKRNVSAILVEIPNLYAIKKGK